jgi:hypothetical protein
VDRNDPKFRRGAEIDAFAAIRSWKDKPMIYEVTLNTPAIHEVVVTSADTEDAAIQMAIYSALQRMLKAGEATCTAVEAPPGEKPEE